VHNLIMAPVKLDDPDLLAAMRAYLAAVDALALATYEPDVLRLSDEKAVAGLLLRKQLAAQGIPSSQRSTT
jgi:hypothetical protein